MRSAFLIVLLAWFAGAASADPMSTFPIPNLQRIIPGWEQTPATGINDVGMTTTGQIWLAGKNGTIWSSYDGQTFQEESGVSGFGRIAGGNKRAEVWAVGRDNHTLWHFARNGWKETDASNVGDVAVGRQCIAGDPACESIVWIAGTNGLIWYSDNDGRRFTQIKADGFCRVAAHSRDLWAVGCNGTLWHYTPSNSAAWDAGTWEQTDASKMLDVAVDEDGSLWLVGQNGSVWTSRTGRDFVEISQGAGFANIAVGHGNVYAVRFDGTLWRHKP